MSINTTLITGHTIIVDPENPAEVGKVIRSGGGDVGYVCSRGNLINMFAKYKPVIKANVINTYDQLKGGTGSDKHQWKSNATWWKGTISSSVSTIDTTSGWVLSTSCGITVRGYYGILRNLVNNWDTNGREFYWTYNPPTGGMAAPYRLIDFNYYDRDAAPPFRDFQAPTEIIRYRYGSEYIVTGQASVRWPSGTTIYQLTMNDLQVRNGAANVDMSDYYFGVVIAMVKSGDTDLTPENRVYGIITAAEKWNETVQPSGAAPQDIRYTQLFPNSFFTGISSGSTLRMYPILSKNRYNGTEAMDYSTVIAGQDNPVYPLPFDPIDCIYHFQEALIQLAVTITRTGTGYLRLNMTARNLTDTQQVVNLDLVTFWFIVYPKDSNHSTQYDQATYYPSDAQTGGAYTWSSDGGETGEIEVPASGTVTLAMNGINYTDSSYGCYITLSMDYPYGVVAGGGATLDYDL